MRRRTLLAALGATGAGGLAGCSEMLEDIDQSNENNTGSKRTERRQSQDTPIHQPERAAPTEDIVQPDDSPNISEEPDRGAELPEDLEPSAETPSEADQHKTNVGEILDEAPDPELVETIYPAVQIVSTDNPFSRTHNVTIQNTGDDGNIAIALFWQMSENPSTPPPESLHVISLDGPYRRAKEKQVFFNADERRTVEFSALPPSGSVGYYFFAEPATYGGFLRNNGSAGRIKVTLYGRGGLQSDTILGEKTIYIGENERKRVVFNQTLGISDEWYLDFSLPD